MGMLEASWTVEIDAPRDRVYEIAADIEGAPDWQGTSAVSYTHLTLPTTPYV